MIDDVIYPFCYGVMEVLRLEGAVKPDTQITRWEMHEDFGMDRDELWYLLHKSCNLNTLYDQPIEASVLRALEEMHADGHYLHIVTARGGIAKEYLWRQVALHDMPIASVSFLQDKGPAVYEFNASFSLDDRPKNYQALDQPNHLTFLKDAPHNKDFFAARRVLTVNEFANVVGNFQANGVQLRGENW